MPMHDNNVHASQQNPSGYHQTTNGFYDPNQQQMGEDYGQVENKTHNRFPHALNNRGEARTSDGKRPGSAGNKKNLRGGRARK